ncbi:MAG: hypothetical protein H7Z40_08980 [Phycisphaerae bacterium]|nr:hypothetical protein [Gemmatimonadaceae bacterium]
MSALFTTCNRSALVTGGCDATVGLAFGAGVILCATARVESEAISAATAKDARSSVVRDVPILARIPYLADWPNSLRKSAGFLAGTQ